MNLAAKFIASFEDRREQVAIVDGDRGTTYGELLVEIERGRSRIVDAALPPMSKVIVQAPKGVPFASATIALAAAGHSVVGIDMAQGDAVYTDRAWFVDADAVITTRKVRRVQRSNVARRGLGRLSIEVPPRLDLPPRELPMIDWDSNAQRLSGECEAIDDEAIVFVVFTGGTTGQPKGVQLSHRAVGAYLEGLNDLPEWAQVTSVIADHPQQVLYGLAHGKTVYLSPTRIAARADHTAKLLFEGQVDCYFGSPLLWSQILATNVHRSATAWPKAVLLGGAPVTRSILERLENELDSSVAVRCLYGMSEAGLIAHISGREKLALLRQRRALGDPVGRLAAGVTVTVAGDGELLVSSASRFSGYVGEPAAGVDDPFATGDIGKLEANALTLAGRKKNMIVQKGVNLYPEQFESRLLQHKEGLNHAFSEVALIPGPPNELGDEHFVLFYVSASTDTSLAAWIGAEVLPRGHAPARAVRMDSLPRTGRQAKIDRQALASRLKQPTLQDIQDGCFALLGETLDGRSRDHRRARAVHSLARRNLARAQQLELASANKTTVVHEPVFILGHQRSGTTLLHHGLASAPSATAMTLTDMLFPHPLGWKTARPLRALARTIHKASKRSERAIALFERHDLDPEAPEEEEWLFAALGLSGFVPAAFSKTLASRSFDTLRDRSTWDPANRQALVHLYRAVINAWHQQQGAAVPKRHIAKNPAFGPLATDLLQAFPDARFIVAVRDPETAIASRVALIAAIHGGRLTSKQTAVIVDDSYRQLSGLTQQLASLPADRVHLVSFEALMADPRKVINAAASFVGLEPPATLPTVRPVDTNQPPADTPGADEVARAVPDFVKLHVQLAAHP